VFGVAHNSSLQLIHLVIGFSDVATLARDIRHKTFTARQHNEYTFNMQVLPGGQWLNYVTTFLRPNKLFDSFIIKLLHVSQLVRITCATVCRTNCGGGFSKFRLAWRHAKFFPAARPSSRTKMLGGAEASLARIETLKALSSEAPKAPRIETPKDVPLPNQLGDLGEHCKLPQWGSGQSPGQKRILVYFEVERTQLVTTNLLFLTLYVTRKLPQFEK